MQAIFFRSGRISVAEWGVFLSGMEFKFESAIDVPVAQLAAWHFGPAALARLLPPDRSIKFLEPAGIPAEGSRATLRVRLVPGVHTRWVAEHRDVDPAAGFTDVLVEGPLHHWEHRHSFLPMDGEPGRSRLLDTVICEPFGGWAGRLLAKPVLRRKLARSFAWRHRQTKLDLESLHHLPPPRALHILMTGASGLIGRSLVPLLEQAGHRVTTLARRAAGPNARVWDPEHGHIDLAGLPRIDAVVHLAGENIADGRWTADRRRAILESRERGTALLARAIATLSPRPAALVCASGASIYRADGRAHDEQGKEDASTFLGHVVQAWEAAADPARRAGIRTVHLRLGVVLAGRGGALAELLPLFRCGLGGPVGHGRMAMSWIALDDAADLFHRACWDNALDGPVNAVAPGAVTSQEFARTLGRILRRPALLRAPAPALRVLFGQMAEETLLADLRVAPGRLTALGHPFRFATLEPALRHCLMR
jgi:uncharacterized protein